MSNKNQSWSIKIIIIKKFKIKFLYEINKKNKIYIIYIYIIYIERIKYYDRQMSSDNSTEIPRDL